MRIRGMSFRLLDPMKRESLPIISGGLVDSHGQCRVGLCNSVEQGRHDKAAPSYYGGA